MSTTDDQRLGQELVRGRILTESQLRTLEEYRASLGGRFQDIAVKLGFVSEERLNKFMAHREHIQAIDLSEHHVDASVLRQIPREFIERNAVVPLEVEREDSTLLATNILDLDVVEEVQFLTDRRVSVAMAPRSQILEKITRFYDSAEAEGVADAPSREEELARKISDPVVAAMARALIEAGVLDAEAWTREFNSGR